MHIEHKLPIAMFSILQNTHTISYILRVFMLVILFALNIGGGYLQSISSACFSSPIIEMNWSMMPHGAPANVCSAF